MPNSIYSNSQYYESKIQLRPFNKEVFDYILKQIKKNNVLISKEVKLKYGIDLYLTSNRFALALGKKLKKAFKGTLKISRTLYSRDRQTSKTLYRVTVLFRLEQQPL